MTTVLVWIKNYWLFLTLVTLTAITVLSLWPLAILPAAPGSDKTHHLIAYAMLMLPVALRKPKHWKLAGLSFIAYSGIIELLQPYVNRYAEWLDLAANTAGIVCGLLIAELILYLFPTTSNRSK